MADLRLEHIYKVYPNGTKAVSDFTMNIEDKEFIVLVGPSGCGKSTTLRMIAGLEDISAGELYIDGKIVNDVEPKDRDIAMVFQNYALYPHMTVYENMAFGLQLRHVPNDIIHQKVLWASNILGLNDYLDRKPKAMSGGQRQRVALGRAILRNPKVMLLDEPLSNLDAKLRAQMRSEIAKLHEELKTTFVYVTHDQVEAMTLGTRVVVMKSGRIQQIDTPKNLYDYPNNKFVAGFIGTPQMNFFEATLSSAKDLISFNFKYSNAKIEVPHDDLLKLQPIYLDNKHLVYVGLRCEDITVDPEKTKNDKSAIDVKISHFEELGNETLIYADTDLNGDGFGETSTRVIVKGTSTYDFKPGQIVKAVLNLKKCHIFDKSTEESVMPRLPEINVLNCKVEKQSIVIGDLKIKLPLSIKAKDGEGELFINSNSIILDDGPFDGKIINFETIGNKKLVYIKVGNRLLFSIANKDYKIGSTVKFDFDYTQILVKNEKESLIQPMPEFDSINGSFINYFTAKNDLSGYKEIIENRILDTKKEYESKKSVLKKEYEKKILDAQKINNVELKEKDDKAYLLEKDKVEKAITSNKVEQKTKINTFNKAHKEKLVSIKNEVNVLYDNLKEEEKASYKKFVEINTDKEEGRKRREEHKNYKDNLPKERNNELTRRINEESIVYETNVNSTNGYYKRENAALKAELVKMKKKFKVDENYASYLSSEFKHKDKELSVEENNDILKQDQLFFFKFGKKYVESTEIISNKMVQSLGTKVFSKTYLLEIPHNAYRIDKDGFDAVVEGSQIVNGKIYYNCKINFDGEPKQIYCILKEKLKVGEKINLKFDITRIQITEKGIGLRIY